MLIIEKNIYHNSHEAGKTIGHLLTAASNNGRTSGTMPIAE